MHGNWSTVPKGNFGRAREMRNELTAAEAHLWKVLRNGHLGIKFRRQHPIGPYIADFCSTELRLVVEVDGDTHTSDESRAYDKDRDDYMAGRGFVVKRFHNDDVLHNLGSVRSELENVIAQMRRERTRA